MSVSPGLSVVIAFGIGVSLIILSIIVAMQLGQGNKECTEHIITAASSRDSIVCYDGGKASFTQTPNGIIYMCTCPNKEHE